MGNVTSMCLNSHYAAALYDGRILLHVVYTCTYVHVHVYVEAVILLPLQIGSPLEGLTDTFVSRHG